MLRQVVPVFLSRRRQVKFLRIMGGLRHHRHLFGIDPAGMPAVHHFVQMPEKSEAGHIRTGMDLVFPADLGRAPVQRGHGGDCLIHGCLGRFLDPVGRTDDPYPQLFRQDQDIAGPPLVVGIHLLRMNHTGHG